MIRLENVSIHQGAFRLERVSLTIPLAKYGILMGKTGSGKTSLLETIAGLRRVSAGRILLGDRDVTDLPPGDRGIGFVPQDGALFRTVSVYNHLAFALTLRDWKRADVHARVTELAEWLAITHLLKRRPVGLSGGEVQRVALGRALSFRPSYLLLDEPLSSLDEGTRDAMIDLLTGLRKGENVTVLHVTHNRHEASRLADIQFRVDNGRLLEGP